MQDIHKDIRFYNFQLNQNSTCTRIYSGTQLLSLNTFKDFPQSCLMLLSAKPYFQNSYELDLQGHIRIHPTVHILYNTVIIETNWDVFTDISSISASVFL